MNAPRPKNKGQPPQPQIQLPVGRQAVGFGLGQIDRQHQIDRPMGARPKDADTARLDPAANGWRRIGDDSAGLGAQQGPVIGHKRGPKCHHFKRQAGFARTRRPQDQQPPPPMRDARCVQDHPVPLWNPHRIAGWHRP